MKPDIDLYTFLKLVRLTIRRSQNFAGNLLKFAAKIYIFAPFLNFYE